ncbi:MAG: MFS transporter [Nitrososphaerota archaeon]|nr:MFS transporter [Nitrososphaerota archaeon]MDG6955916.1 MFS transporter [Nitrososphaerota archaeon]MDG6959278.1 MFS transporter [Nitrososphaerota archaeon]MDG6969127.1 MFS transporter [Nitrososphaerota archaeon]MDG6971993.1 MFS transporter [Nitrososphaerota archaeon]
MSAARTAPEETPPGGGSGSYERVAIIIVMMGVLMSAVDTTAVVLGLPVMMRDLSSNVLSMIWVIMAYLLIITILGTQVGKLGDIFGRVRMYNLGFGVFTAGSLLCGLSATGPEIIGFRVVQGLGGALISSNSGAIIADTFPAHRRGRAFGITGFGWSAGAILGILVGGAFVTFLSWRYIFFINVPIGVVATVVGYLVLRDKTARVKSTIDVLGMLLFGSGLFFLLTALTDVTGSGLTISSEAELAASVPLLIGFVVWERHCSSPLLDLSLLRRRVLTASMSAAFFQSLASFAVLFLVIMYLQGPRGLSPWDASLYLIPGYVLGGTVAPFAGRLSDRLGARVVASVGLVLQSLGIVAYSTLALGTPLYTVVLASVLNGAGSSAFFPANSSAVMASAPQRSYGMASGLLRTFSNVGMVSSFAVALLIAALSIPRQLAFEIFLGVTQISGGLSQAFVDGMHSALLASISLLAVALVLSVLRGKEARTEVARAGADT